MAQLKFQILCICLSLTCIEGRGRGVFIPEELSSFLSIIYSNVPTITAGEDSRIGVGFRLGPNADFQMLLELGPQIQTRPLPTQMSQTFSKRQVEKLGNANVRNVRIVTKSEESRASANKTKTTTTKAKSRTKKKLMTRNSVLMNWLFSMAKQMERERHRTNQSEPLSTKQGAEKLIKNVSDKSPKNA